MSTTATNNNHSNSNSPNANTLKTLVDVIVELNRRSVQLDVILSGNPEEQLKKLGSFAKSLSSLSTIVKSSAEVIKTLAESNLKISQIKKAYQNVDRVLSFSNHIIETFTFKITENFKKLDIVESKGYTLTTDKDGKQTKVVYTDKDGYVVKTLEAIKMTYEVITGTLNLITSINQQFGWLKGNVLLIKTRRNLKMLVDFINIDLFNFIQEATAKFKDINQQKIDALGKQISFVKTLFDNIRNLCISIILLPPLIMIASVAIWMVVGFLKVLNYVMKFSQNLFLMQKGGDLGSIFLEIGKVVLIIVGLAGLYVLAGIIIPKSIAGLLLTVVFSVMLIGFIYVLSLMSKVLYRFDALELTYGLLRVGIILATILGMALIAILFTIIIVPAIKGILMGSLFVLALIPFMLVLMLLGYVVGLLTPGLVAIAAALVLVVVVIMSLALIGLLLMALQYIPFDKEKVLTTVRDIIEVVTEIMSAIFADPANNSSNPGSGILNFITSIFAGLGMVVQGLAASIWLTTAVFSIAAILLISFMLKWIKFDATSKNEVKQSIKLIIEVVTYLVDTIIYGEGEKQKGEKSGTFSELFGSIGNGLTKIVESISSFGYLVFIMVSIAIILLISKMLKWITFSKSDADMAVENVKMVLDSVEFIRKSLSETLSPSNGENANRGLFGSIISLFSPGLANIVDGLFNLGSLVFMFISIALIKGLASFLITLTSIKTTDLQMAKNSAIEVVQTAQSIMNSLFNTPTSPKESSEGGFWGWLKDTGRSLFNFVGGIGDMVDGLLKLGQVAGLMVGIGLISKLANMMTELSKSAQLDSSLTGNVSKLLNTSQSIVKQLIQDEELGSKDTFKKLEGISKTYDVVGNILKSFQGINIGSNFDKSVAGLKNLQSVVKEMGGVSEKEVSNQKKVVDNYLKFLEKVNVSDAAKLSTTSKIMENMVKLSESINGNFDGLARSFNEYILPALEKLNETMKEVVETLDKGVEQNASIAAMNTGSEAMTPTNIDKASAGNVEAKRAMERAKLAQDYSTASIGDLYDLFATGDAKVKIR